MIRNLVKINKIIETMKKKNSFSIAMCDELNVLMTSEGILPSGYILRFRPLFGDFDLVPVNWFRSFNK